MDIGTEKAAFLHVSDLQEEVDEDDGEDGDNGNGRRTNRHNRKYPPIQDQLEQGQELLVQVTKEPIGTKGPRVTSQISMPGRFIVYIPGGSRSPHNGSRSGGSRGGLRRGGPAHQDRRA